MRGRGGHGHNDITSFELFLNGMNVVSDCGAYLYTASREWRNRFRSTAFHNVAQVDGEELNRFIGPDALWQLMYDAHPVDLEWKSDGFGGYFCGGHDGYARLAPPVASVRELFVDPTRPRVALRDRLSSARPSSGTTWRFHFDPALDADAGGAGLPPPRGGREVWLLAADEADTRERRIEPGWVSAGYGVRMETSVLVIPDNQMPATLACVFADTRLTAEERREVTAQLDAHRARIH